MLKRPLFRILLVTQLYNIVINYIRIKEICDHTFSRSGDHKKSITTLLKMKKLFENHRIIIRIV